MRELEYVRITLEADPELGGTASTTATALEKQGFQLCELTNNSAAGTAALILHGARCERVRTLTGTQ